MKHYHVITGLGGGYMPNTNVINPCKRSAEGMAAELAREWRDDQDTADLPRSERRIMRGSARTGGYVFSRFDAYDLGEYIEITGPCYDDCEDEE